ncbi:hypothetical protein [Methylocystis parvus]|uniref:hypothetical protein n=1 Tax=Methylocystis parvus TaxID=134 RepID=UPI003C747E07
MDARTVTGVHLYTSFTYSYLQRARVLAKTVRRAHPDWKLWAVLVDAPPPTFDDAAWRGEFDFVLDAATLFPNEWAAWIFKHDIVEACTAVKGRALMHILDQGADKAIYLDPDIAVFHGLDTVVERLNHSSIVLTPHQIEPNATLEEMRDNEFASMKYGIFNLGFLAVRNNSEGRAMARWWADCLYHACYDDVPNGVFTDQKYCDHVPGLFDNVFIDRDPGCNVASWNLSRRKLTIDADGKIRVNGNLLRFYHFTKINGDGDVMTNRYARGNLAVFEVWNWYKRAIAAMELPGIPKQYWVYAKFKDGALVERTMRLLYRSRPDLWSRFRDPFAAGQDSYRAWLAREGRTYLEQIK